MTSEDLFTVAKAYENKARQKDAAPKQPKDAQTPKAKVGSNVPEMSVSDLASSLKRTLEDNFSHIRVRGELSGIKIAASGHLYGDIKDVDANVNIICWKGTMNKLPIRPEDGMDVIVTGRVSSYPKSSRYQIIIEKMELAGEGALLKLLEDRRKKLNAEGLFDEAYKKPLPYLPQVIGVITSPTGAVIRDIMHRLRERFPRHVLLWPVNVQGTGADAQITNAIEGFNKLDGTGLPRPDLIIVARGGGSLEDLMPFNEENVVRATAASTIPIISAVGHETDTTLIDYASDKRSPTPTGAAEIAVPVRADLIGYIQNCQSRLATASLRMISDHKNKLNAQAGKLSHPRQILENKAQTIDLLSEKLNSVISLKIQQDKTRLTNSANKLISPQSILNQHNQGLEYLNQRLERSVQQNVKDHKTALESQLRMLKSLSHESVLSRGFALIYDDNGNLVRQSEDVNDQEALTIEFGNQDKLGVRVQK